MTAHRFGSSAGYVLAILLRPEFSLVQGLELFKFHGFGGEFFLYMGPPAAVCHRF
jgi:hypothetical protein